MPQIVEILFLVVAMAGHVAIWIHLDNRIHASGLSRRMVKLSSLGIRCLLLGGAAILVSPWAAFVFQYWPFQGPMWRTAVEAVTSHMAFRAYISLCFAVGLVPLPAELHRRWTAKTTPLLISNHTAVLDVRDRLGPRPTKGLEAAVLTRLPRNQIFQLTVQQKTLELPRLPQSLDGLTITHLSDLHMAGHVNLRFFEEVVAATNELNSDIIVLTGDLVEAEHCLDWIELALKGLSCRLGPYFILGNHELRLRNIAELRRRLQEAGMQDLGGQIKVVRSGTEDILLAGSEIPWFKPAPDVQAAASRHAGGPTLRILLSHSPDQFNWARRHDFDVMLAGHTHGGQIRLPLLGALVAPSRYGAKYASGIFYESPTLLHVSRGVSGLTPLRWRCPPEIAKLTLRCRRPRPEAE